MRSISILGSTGSVGRQTLDLIAHHVGKYKVGALSAHSNVDLLAMQARVFKPELVAIGDESLLPILREKLAEYPNIEVMGGHEGVRAVGAYDADCCFAAIMGMAGLLPTLDAIARGKTVAFASKECLVSAGSLMMEAVKRAGTTFLPVDSEHNAIFQVFEAQNRKGIERLIITASGGPFLGWTREQMRYVSIEQALAHPTWSMGRKISIDSATMMNKALEIIEAHYLFDMPSEKIDVLVHPQSIVHSLVEYADGSVLAQMGASDMRTPLSYCLGWPERIETCGAKLDLTTMGTLNFIEPDLVRFPALSIVRDVMAAGQAEAITFNAANEVAVAAFLDGKIGFPAIVNMVEKMLQSVPRINITSIEDVMELDEKVRVNTNAALIEAA